MKINIIIVLLTLITTSLNGQVFIGSDVSAQVVSETLIIDQVASFTIGFENTCPDLQFYEFYITNESMMVELFYDITGAWPQVGCSEYDQILINPFDTTICNLSVATNIITYDSLGTGIDTIFQADLDTFNFCETSIDQHYQNQKIEIFPNPTNDKLYIEYQGNLKIIEIFINDMKGNLVKSLNPNQKEFDIKCLTRGNYVLQIRTEKNVISKIIIIE
jgi:hypothetical protein